MEHFVFYLLVRHFCPCASFQRPTFDVCGWSPLSWFLSPYHLWTLFLGSKVVLNGHLHVFQSVLCPDERVML